MAQRGGLESIVGQEELLALIESYVGPTTLGGARPAWDSSARNALGFERLSWQLAVSVLHSLETRDGTGRARAVFQQVSSINFFIVTNRDASFWR